MWSIALNGAVNLRFREVHKKYLESFESWCRRRIDKVNWTDRAKKEEALHRVTEKRNILHKVN